MLWLTNRTVRPSLRLTSCIKDFVDDQYFRVEEGSHGKTKADGHARAVSFDGGVDISFTAAEVDNLVQFAGNLGFGHTKDGAVEEDVFPSGHLLVESRTHFEQGADTSPCTNGASSGAGDFGEYLEQGAFACTIPPDNPNNVALLHLEVDVAESPDILAFAFGGTVVHFAYLQIGVFFAEHIDGPPTFEVVVECTCGYKTKTVLLGDIIEFYCR